MLSAASPSQASYLGYMMSILEESRIVVFTTSWCADCHRAKHMLEEHGVSFLEIDVEKDATGMEFVRRVNNGRRIVPTILFPDGQVLVEPPISELLAKLGLQDSDPPYPLF